MGKEALIRIVLVEESVEISDKQIKKEILREAFIPWCKKIVRVAVRE
jgi:hypothetical protein